MATRRGAIPQITRRTIRVSGFTANPWHGATPAPSAATRRTTPRRSTTTTTRRRTSSAAAKVQPTRRATSRRRSTTTAWRAERSRPMAVATKHFFVVACLRRPHLAWRQPAIFWKLYDGKHVELAKHQTLGKNVSLRAFELNGPLGQQFCKDANGTGLPAKCAAQRQLAAAARRAEVAGHHGYASDMASLIGSKKQGAVYRAGPGSGDTSPPLPAELQRELKRELKRAYYASVSFRLRGRPLARRSGQTRRSEGQHGGGSACRPRVEAGRTLSLEQVQQLEMPVVQRVDVHVQRQRHVHDALGVPWRSAAGHPNYGLLSAHRGVAVHGEEAVEHGRPQHQALTDVQARPDRLWRCRGRAAHARRRQRPRQREL